MKIGTGSGCGNGCSGWAHYPLHAKRLCRRPSDADGFEPSAGVEGGGSRASGGGEGTGGGLIALSAKNGLGYAPQVITNDLGSFFVRFGDWQFVQLCRPRQAAYNSRQAMVFRRRNA